VEIDKWALLKLHKLIKKVTDAYENYEFHVVYHSIHNFCAVDMSAIYLDIIKDRVYTERSDSRMRRSSQTVTYEILMALVKMLVPILDFTTEELWQYLPGENKAASVQIAGWPEFKPEMLDEELEKKWERILAVREFVAKPLEEARRSKIIGHSLDAAVHLYAGPELYQFLQSIEKDLATYFITSAVVLHPETEAPGEVYRSEEMAGLAVKVEKAPGEKCERCWIYSETVGQTAEHPTLCKRCSEVLA